MKTGDELTAPCFLRRLHHVRWRVRVRARPQKGNVLVTWLEGSLRGREARLETRTLAKPA